MLTRRHLLIALPTILAACGGGGGLTEAYSFTVAFYGDSITSGTHSSDPVVWTPEVWSPTPVEHMAQLAGVRAYDYSYNGASVADCTIRNDDSDLVVLRFGVADSVRGMDSSTFATNLMWLIDDAQIKGKRVLLTGLPHAASVDTQPLDLANRKVAEHRRIPFVDVYALPFSIRPSDLADSLHPGEAYSRRIGAAVAEQIVRMK